MIGQMVGLQWYDASSKTLEEKAKTAMAQYKHKIGKSALICLVSIKDADGADFDALSKACGVPVRSVTILPKHHLWVGEEVEVQA